MITISTDTISTNIKNDDNQDTLAAISRCIPLLEKIADHSELLAHLPEPQRIALITAAGKISRPDRREIKKRNKDKKQQKHLAIINKERRLRAGTGIRKARETDVFAAPRQIAFDEGRINAPDTSQRLETPRNCYVCKAKFTQLHHFYDAMC
ncbi:MAG: oxidoreductase, partial [Desulfobacula sp.]|nr:oxidoreductase [Desulfobacula sp.]